jgi:hypothetical protein
MGALEAMNGDIEAAIENLLLSSLKGTKVNWLKPNSVRYYIGTCSRLPVSEQKRLQNMSTDGIIASIARRKYTAQ